MKASTRFVQSAVNLGAAGALLWFAAPLLAFGTWHPFDDMRARVALLALVALLLLGLRGLRVLLARRRNERLLKGLESGDAGPELSQRFRQALAMLRQGIEAKGTRRWWQGRRQVQQLPWYLIIGAPGGGKTTALLHSGLRFPLAERLGRDPLAGTGGTRHCDWWFSQDAVFIDTAGRYTTQDSDAAADAREWQQFLALLRRHRPVQPINGVIVSVSVPDLLHGGAELARQAAAVAARLDELRRELDLAFPVYLLVTKADLLAGFVETFGDLDAAQREQLWGLVFDADAAGIPADLGPRLADLAQRLARRSPEALQHERTAAAPPADLRLRGAVRSPARTPRRLRAQGLRRHRRRTGAAPALDRADERHPGGQSDRPGDRRTRTQPRPGAEAAGATRCRRQVVLPEFAAASAW